MIASKKKLEEKHPVRVAIPLFGTRVAPRCLYADSMLLASIENGKVDSRSVHRVAESAPIEPEDWVDMLIELGVEVVCLLYTSPSPRD